MKTEKIPTKEDRKYLLYHYMKDLINIISFRCPSCDEKLYPKPEYPSVCNHGDICRRTPFLEFENVETVGRDGWEIESKCYTCNLRFVTSINTTIKKITGG